MKIALFGANGPTGRLATQQALDAGHLVTAVTRHPAAFPIRHPRLLVLSGDVLKPLSVEDAVRDQEAVLSTLGVPFSRAPITTYSAGVTNIIRAMHRQGLRRLVCVSSSAVDPAAGPHGGLLFERVVQPLVVAMMGHTLYDDMRRMETLVRESGLDWTIIRPSGLFETPAVTNYQVAERYLNTKFTSRADLASAVVAQLTESAYLHKILAVGTVDTKPSLLRLLWREGISKKRSAQPVGTAG